jgi:hypothetical protein
VDEKELLKSQIQAYEFYAGLIERAVGGGALAKLPRWDEQRAFEYRDLAEQLKRQLAELEAQEAQRPSPAAGEQAAAEEQPAQRDDTATEAVTMTGGEQGSAPRG